MLAVACVLLVLGGLAARSLRAQETAVPVQSRLRLQRAEMDGWTTGTLERSDADSLHLATESGMLGVARAAITRLELSRGMRSHTLKGALYGGIIMGTIGAGLGAAVAASDETEDGDLGVIEGALILGGVGVAAGSLLGAGIGTLIRTERWEAVDAQSLQISVFLSPAPGSIRVGLSAAF